jgi:predicted RND superfamily exporter protein
MPVTLYGLLFTSFDTSFQAFLEKDNPNLQSLLKIQDEFSSSENNALVIISPKSGKVFEQKTLNVIDEATEKAWALPYIKNVISITSTPRVLVSDDGLDVVEFFNAELQTDSNDIALLEQEALSNPNLIGRLISEDGTVAAIYLDFDIPQDEHSDSVLYLGDEILKLKSDVLRQIEADVYFSGNVFFDHALFEVMVHDLLYLFPLVCLIVVAFLSYILRSFVYTLITFSVTFLSLMITIAIAGWLGIALNTVSILCTMVIISIAVADNIHFFNSYIDCRRADISKLPAIHKSISSNFVAMFLTSFTTAIGFLTMNFSESPPFHDLGNLTAIGVMLDFFLTVAFVPAIVAWLPDKSQKFKKGKFINTKALGLFVLNNNKLIAALVFPVSFILLLSIPNNELNDDSLTWFDKDMEFRQSTDFAAEHLSGLRYIVYTLQSPSENGINDPAYLRQVEKFIDWYAEQPEVTHQHHYLNILKEINKKMHDDDEEWSRLPDSVESASQSLFLLELGQSSEGELNMFYSYDKSSLRLVVSLKNLTNKEYIGLEKRAYSWMVEHIPDIASRGASIPIMFAKVGQDNLERMVFGGLLATLLITLVIALALRSVSYGLLSIIPNALPIGVTYGVWGLFVGELNLAAAVMFSVSIGIVVDDTVHFLYRYLYATRTKGLAHNEAVLYVFEKVGGALLTTTLVLSAGLFVLSFSSFTMSATIGAMVTLTILFGLFFDFFCLPALLEALRKDN